MFELAEDFEVVIDAVYWRHDGLRHGCFGDASRGDAGGCTHGNGDGGDGDGVGVCFVVVKIKQSLLDSTALTNVSMKV